MTVSSKPLVKSVFKAILKQSFSKTHPGNYDPHLLYFVCDQSIGQSKSTDVKGSLVYIQIKPYLFSLARMAFRATFPVFFFNFKSIDY